MPRDISPEAEGMLYQPATLGHSESSPKVVAINHLQHGTGTQTLEHRVQIKDSAGLLLADFPAAWAARWLKERGYQYVTGTNGVWRR